MTERTRLVTPEPCVVYRTAGRRYLTKRAAYVAAARRMIDERCGCEAYEYGVTCGFVCRYHEQDYYPKLLMRLARFLQRAERRDAGSTHD